MTQQPTPDELRLALECAEKAQAEHGHKGPTIWALESALAAIRATSELAEQLARAREAMRVRLYEQNEAAINAYRASEAFEIAEAIKANDHLKGPAA